jgi:hypothetical protein
LASRTISRRNMVLLGKLGLTKIVPAKIFKLPY